MPQRIFFSGLAIAQLRGIDRLIAMRILNALNRLLQTGEGDVKSLQGSEPPELRLRVGDYRVRYHLDGDSIHVHTVAHRRDAYR